MLIPHLKKKRKHRLACIAQADSSQEPSIFMIYLACTERARYMEERGGRNTYICWAIMTVKDARVARRTRGIVKSCVNRVM